MLNSSLKRATGAIQAHPYGTTRVLVNREIAEHVYPELQGLAAWGYTCMFHKDFDGVAVIVIPPEMIGEWITIGDPKA